MRIINKIAIKLKNCQKFKFKFVLACNEFKTYLETNPNNGKTGANATTFKP